MPGTRNRNRTCNYPLGVLCYRKSGVKNAIFLDFRAFYALKCVYFEAFCSFRQVIFNSNANLDIENYTKTIPILIQWKEEKSNFISEMLLFLFFRLLLRNNLCQLLFSEHILRFFQHLQKLQFLRDL